MCPWLRGSNSGPRIKQQCKHDPNKFAQNLFAGQSLNGSPTFSKECAESYFKRTYSDPDRGMDYSPFESMDRPPPPVFPFFLKPPTFKKLKKSVKSKRNAATPGMNSRSYLPYKKCDSILRIVHKLFVKIFESKDVPGDWAIAFIVLLQKYEDRLDDPSEFRPIAITDTIGKLFFLQHFLVRNKYISTSKGFPVRGASLYCSVREA